MVRADALNLVLVLLAFCCWSCSSGSSENPTLTFYHWETNLSPSPTTRHLLDSFACDRLYVKAFDLDWANGEPRQSARLEFGDTTGLPQLVPIIFITNSVVRNTPEGGEQELARRIVAELDDLFPNGYAELQLDCDWTAGTRVRYFGLLKAVKTLRPTVMLTCTVRLHQYRDRQEQGIPPVDRGTLMAYNTGDLDDWATENSIYDSTIVKAYVANQPEYPLDLDLAVAVYDWAAVYRRGQLAYLYNEPEVEALEDTTKFGLAPSLDSPRYYVKQSTYLGGTYLYAGDEIRWEVVPPSSVQRQQELLQRYVKSFPGQRLMVFRLESRLWSGASQSGSESDLK